MNPKSFFTVVLSFTFVSVSCIHFSLNNANAWSDDPRPAAFFANNVRVNSGGTPYAWQVEPTLVVADNGMIHVGWKEANSDAGGGIRVSYSNSVDNGNTWSPNILMATANPGARASDPWLIKDEQGRMHFTRLEFDSIGTLSGITTSNTTDGSSWGNTNYLDDMPNFADKETVAVDPDGVLYMAYNSNTFQNNMVIRKSFDGGATWTSRVQIPDIQGDVIGAYIALDASGRVFVAWTDYANGNILIDSSLDGGTTWGADIRVNDVPGTVNDPSMTTWNLSLPAVAIDAAENVYVVWTDYRNMNSFGDIYVARSRNHGASWDAAVRVNDYTGPAGQRMADLTVDDNGILHCAWYDHRLGGYDVYYSNSSDGGQTWSPNLRVTTATTPRAYPRPGDYITIRTNPLDNNVYVVWTDGRGVDFDIYFASMFEPLTVQVIETNPSGLQVTIDGTPYTAPQIRNWAVGEIHELGTFAVQNLSSTTKYVFVNWSDGGLIVHQVTVKGPATYTANFDPQYYLDVVSPYGTTNGTGWYAGGDLGIGCVDPTSMYLSPDTRVYFRGWTGDVTGIGNCFNPILMDGPKTAIATWETQYLVNATSPYGTVLGGGWHDEGNTTVLSLDIGLVEISPDERVRFISWTGDASGIMLTSDPIVVDSPKNATALWRTEFLLTIISAHGTPHGGGWYLSGSDASISIETIVDTGTGTRYVFISWGGSISTDEASTTVSMSGPATVIAQWKTEHNVTVLSDHGSVTGSGWYENGSFANISAPTIVHDTEGTWIFIGWTGDYISSDNSSSVVVDHPMVIRANWEKQIEGDGGVSATDLSWILLIAIAVILAFVILFAYLRKRKDKEEVEQEPPAKE